MADGARAPCRQPSLLAESRPLARGSHVAVCTAGLQPRTATKYIRIYLVLWFRMGELGEQVGELSFSQE